MIEDRIAPSLASTSPTDFSILEKTTQHPPLTLPFTRHPLDRTQTLPEWNQFSARPSRSFGSLEINQLAMPKHERICDETLRGVRASAIRPPPAEKRS